jgi:hypothetical protein
MFFIIISLLSSSECLRFFIENFDFRTVPLRHD